MKLNLNDKDIERYWKRVDRRGPDDCWPWKGALHTSKRYGTITVEVKRRTLYKTYYVELAHRMAKYLADGDVPADKIARHCCQNSLCQNPAHIYWADNSTLLPVYVAKGAEHPRAKLTWAQVRAIRARMTNGATIWKLAKEYNVDPTTIRNIHLGLTWKETL